MSAKGKIRIHVQIEQENQSNLEQWKKRQDIKEFYSLYCRAGRYNEAWLLLKLLQNGHVSFGLDDEAARIERLLGNLGFKGHYNRNFTIAKFTL